MRPDAPWCVQMRLEILRGCVADASAPAIVCIGCIARRRRNVDEQRACRCMEGFLFKCSVGCSESCSTFSVFHSRRESLLHGLPCFRAIAAAAAAAAAAAGRLVGGVTLLPMFAILDSQNARNGKGKEICLGVGLSRRHTVDQAERGYRDDFDMQSFPVHLL